MLTGRANFALSSVIEGTTFTMTNIKLYVQVVTLWNQDNAKLMQQLKLFFEITTSWNKY